MRSIRALGAVAAAMVAAGLAPAVPATASTAPKWHKTFSAKGYDVWGSATAVSPNGSTVFATGQAMSPGYPLDVSFGETIAYNAATGAVIWTAKFNPHPGVDDNGFSSIAVSPNGSTVFVTGHSGDANQATGLVQAIVAYNAATGAKLWQVTGTPVPGGSIGGSLSPLAVSPSSSTVFVTNPVESMTGQTVAYNASTGAARWTQPAGGNAIALSANASRLYVAGEQSGSATVHGDTEAFNATTGAKIWQASVGGTGVYLGGAKLSPDGSTLFASGASNSTNSFVVAYSASTGAPLWTAHVGTGGNSVGLGVTPSGSSVIVSEAINAGPPSNGVNWVNLALNPATGATLWRRADDFPKNGPTAYAYAMSPDGSIAYITGATYNPPNQIGDKYLTIGFSTASGKPVWNASYAGLARNYAYAMAVSPNGSHIFVTGTSNAGPALTDYDIMDTVAYATR
jgi:hypothetical protein